MSIVRRCTWLAEYIDRAGDGDPQGLLWQIIGDIKDIAGFLEKLDDRYFTVDTCSIPVVDMERPEYQEVFDDLFERMEQYRPDDAGIFTECLLPYEFTRLSTGEYQYAKVLGGMEDYLKLSFSDRTNRGLDKIILMDEPEHICIRSWRGSLLPACWESLRNIRDLLRFRSYSARIRHLCFLMFFRRRSPG